MEYRWNNLPLPAKSIVQELQSALGIDGHLCVLLAQRGVTSFEEARDFFRPSLKKLHDPFLMKDMEAAVARINQAIEAGERILIYGDYDVDGTTSVALVYSFLIDHFPLLSTYIPDRYKEGYGVSTAGIDYAEDNGISLIIALDCGIKAIDKVAYAKEKGIDFIICDHHRPGSEIPGAVAVLDPKREDCQYPFKELSGCGVGFKLVQALCQDWQLPADSCNPLLDLLAISIGADIVPIVGENRILAHHGLKLINSRPRKGIQLLKEIANKKDAQLSITDVVFMIGPRINAAGRIAHGQLAVDLLISDDDETVEKVCAQINDHNNERRELDSSITLEALDMIESQKEHQRKSTVLFSRSWHKGVIGIVASRLMETYYRPTIVFTESRGVLAGSARSVKGFDVYNALDSCRDILEQFGGHMYAAGMTLQEARFEHFKEKFEEVVSSTIKPEQLTPELDIDLSVGLGCLNHRFYRILKQFAPFGPENMKPIFVTHGLKDSGYSRVVGQDKTHLRLDLVEQSSGLRIQGIAFGMADKLELIKKAGAVSVAYHLDLNVFNGKESLQMQVKDIKPTAEAMA